MSNVQKIKYQEGDLFAVPLQPDGYAVGLIARMKKGRGAKRIFGYFFGETYHKLPSTDELACLKLDNAIFVCRFSDLGLHNGTWPIIGKMERWERADWPMPYFVRYDAISGDAFRIIYDENDPHAILSEEKCDKGEAKSLPSDGLYGAVAVQALLSDKLKTKLNAV